MYIKQQGKWIASGSENNESILIDFTKYNSYNDFYDGLQEEYPDIFDTSITKKKPNKELTAENGAKCWVYEDTINRGERNNRLSASLFGIKLNKIPKRIISNIYHTSISSNKWFCSEISIYDKNTFNPVILYIGIGTGAKFAGNWRFFSDFYKYEDKLSTSAISRTDEFITDLYSPVKYETPITLALTNFNTYSNGNPYTPIIYWNKILITF